MKFTQDKSILIDKGNKYFKLFKLFYEYNQNNRKKNSIEKNILKEININYFDESKNYYDNNISILKNLLLLSIILMKINL